MYKSYLNDIERTRSGITAFGGYNHQEVIADNELYDDMNMTSDAFPVLATRKARKIHGITQNISLGDIVKIIPIKNDPQLSLLYIISTGQHGGTHKARILRGSQVYIVGSNDGTAIDPIDDFENIIFFNDKYYVMPGMVTLSQYEDRYEITDTNHSFAFNDPRSPDQRFYYPTLVTPMVANTQRDDYTEYTSTAIDDGGILLQPAPYTKISCSETATRWANIFSVGEYATVKCYPPKGEQNTITGKIVKVDTDNGKYVIIDAECRWKSNPTLNLCPVYSISSSVPILDNACISNNRMWGYSNEKHEIYASALGDGMVWDQFKGISTDSFAASIPNEDEIVGCIGYQNSVLFFTQNKIIRYSGTAPSNFTQTQLITYGLKKNAHNTISVCNNTLFYLSPYGMCAYQGGMPELMKDCISHKEIDIETGGDATAESFGNRYYIKCKYADEGYKLFCFDTERGIWHREDSGGSIIYQSITFDMSTNPLVASNDGVFIIDMEPDDNHKFVAVLEIIDGKYVELENEINEPIKDFGFTTAEFGLLEPDCKYYSRLQFRCKGSFNTTLRIEAEYDNSGIWEDIHTQSEFGRNATTIEAIPRRCDTMRLRFSGVGDFRLYGIYFYRENGSDAR